MARWKRLLKTWTSLFCVTAVCILLNLLGSKLNGALGLPLYLDNMAISPVLRWVLCRTSSAACPIR